MSLTHIATRSIPTVSSRAIIDASFSLVPTPSVADTSTGLRNRSSGNSYSAPKPPSPPNTPAPWVRGGDFRDALRQRIAGVDVDAAVDVSQGSFLRRAQTGSGNLGMCYRLQSGGRTPAASLRSPAISFSASAASRSPAVAPPHWPAPPWLGRIPSPRSGRAWPLPRAFAPLRRQPDPSRRRAPPCRTGWSLCAAAPPECRRR